MDNHSAALSIAGSDSGGGAGIQADLKTFQRHGVFGTTVITAVTAQNTRGVSAVSLIKAQEVKAQLQSVLEGFPIKAIKTGMLPSAECIEAVRDGLTGNPMPLVVDPVMVATSGDRLIDTAATQSLSRNLLPLASLITPNTVEAEILSGIPINGSTDMRKAAEKLLSLGCKAVLLKGGHLEGETVEDILLSPEGQQSFRHPRLPGRFHGTGCTLSAAICANLALGMELSKAVAKAITYLQGCMAKAWQPPFGSLKVLDHRV